MRKINYIVIHCTATPQTTTAAMLKKMFRQRGWRAPGYHYVIAPNGDITPLLSTAKIANGVKGHNADAIHIAYIGGVSPETGRPVDNRTPEQKRVLRAWINFFRAKYPGAQILGHRDLSPDLNGDGIVSQNEWVKVCPCFDVRKEYDSSPQIVVNKINSKNLLL